LKKGAISLNIYLLSKASAKIPPVPPFEKGGRSGDLKRPLQKAKLIPFFSRWANLFGRIDKKEVGHEFSGKSIF
jgi:hypothetical protein